MLELLPETAGRSAPCCVDCFFPDSTRRTISEVAEIRGLRACSASWQCDRRGRSWMEIRYPAADGFVKAERTSSVTFPVLAPAIAGGNGVDLQRELWAGSPRGAIRVDADDSFYIKPRHLDRPASGHRQRADSENPDHSRSQKDTSSVRSIGERLSSMSFRAAQLNATSQGCRHPGVV